LIEVSNRRITSDRTEALTEETHTRGTHILVSTLDSRLVSVHLSVVVENPAIIPGKTQTVGSTAGARARSGRRPSPNYLIPLPPNLQTPILVRMNEISHSVCQKLKHYVYLYIDPRDNQPFYVGKGKGRRMLAHLNATSATEKVKRIAELRKIGLEPVIEILKYGLTKREAFLVESAAIELIGVDQLANRVKGHHAGENGRGLLRDIVNELGAKEVKITHPVILINIRRLYRYGMSPIDLYDATRGIWKAAVRRERAEYAFSIYAGNVRAVYSIVAWVPAGSTMTARDYSEKDYELSERFEFVGNLAPEPIQRKYVGKSVRRYFAPGARNPIKYVNC